MRTARSATSGENFGDFLILAPFSIEGASSKSGAVQYGVRFSEVHVWRLLGAMGFSSQKPERRAIERDESAVLAWKRKAWPALKKSVPPSGD